MNFNLDGFFAICPSNLVSLLQCIGRIGRKDCLLPAHAYVWFNSKLMLNYLLDALCELKAAEKALQVSSTDDEVARATAIADVLFAKTNVQDVESMHSWYLNFTLCRRRWEHQHWQPDETEPADCANCDICNKHTCKRWAKVSFSPQQTSELLDCIRSATTKTTPAINFDAVAKALHQQKKTPKSQQI